VRLLFVRHGHAGTKEGWAGEDRLRPLDTGGLRQAKHLLTVLTPFRPTAILSSPYVRCLQTVEPLATKRGVSVDEEEDLVPNAGLKAVALVRRVSQPGSRNRLVLCTHGEVIGDVLAALANEDHLRLGHRSPGLKGCVWVIEFRKGKAVTARYIPPAR
jgi:8-oxo-dGTP diphosphatase